MWYLTPVILALLACIDPPVVDQASCPPELGQVLRVETGELHESLDDALDDESPWLTLCLGEGEFPVSQDLNLAAAGRLRTQVALYGAGAEATRIVLADDALITAWTLQGPPDLLLIADLSFGLPVFVHATEVRIGRAGWQGTVSPELPLGMLQFESLEANQLFVNDNTFGYNALTFIGTVDEEVVLRDLTAHQNTGTFGRLLAFQTTAAALIDPDMEGNVDATAGSGFPLVWAQDELRVTGARVVDNRNNGPQLYAQDLTLTDSVLQGNRSANLGNVLASDRGLIQDTQLLDNVSPDAAISWVPSGQGALELDAVDFGVDNRPCDLSWYGVCQLTASGLQESGRCDASGCDVEQPDTGG